MTRKTILAVAALLVAAGCGRSGEDEMLREGVSGQGDRQRDRLGAAERTWNDVPGRGLEAEGTGADGRVLDRAGGQWREQGSDPGDPAPQMTP